MRILLRSLLVFLALMAGMAATVRAQSPAQPAQNCQGVVAPPVDFGAFDSNELYKQHNSRQFDTSFKCEFGGFNVAAPSELKVTAQSANNGAMIGPGLAQVSYKLYNDLQKAINLPFNQTVKIPQGLSGFLIWGNSLGGSVQLLLETQASALPVAGTYTDTITLKWEWGYCSFLGNPVGCASWWWQTGSAVTTVKVGITVRKSCNFNSTTAALNFDPQPLVSMFKPSTAKLEINCTRDTTYKLYAGDGENLANGMRRMKGPGNNYIEYQLYQQGTNVVISQAAPINDKGTGKNESITIEGRINTQQADVPVGIYIDRPIVTIEY